MRDLAWIPIKFGSYLTALCPYIIVSMDTVIDVLLEYLQLTTTVQSFAEPVALYMLPLFSRGDPPSL